jgi:hypothetical protein
MGEKKQIKPLVLTVTMTCDNESVSISKPIYEGCEDGSIGVGTIVGQAILAITTGWDFSIGPALQGLSCEFRDGSIDAEIVYRAMLLSWAGTSASWVAEDVKSVRGAIEMLTDRINTILSEDRRPFRLKIINTPTEAKQ